MDRTKILLHFGQRVRKIRKSVGLSQEELSYKSNVNRTYIGMIERGEKNVTLLTIVKIAKALEINITDLFE